MCRDYHSLLYSLLSVCPNLSYSNLCRFILTSLVGESPSYRHLLCLRCLPDLSRPLSPASSMGLQVSLSLSWMWVIMYSRYLWPGGLVLTVPTVVTAALEVAGRLVLSHGLASSFRPRRYYTIPKETLEGILEDVGQLIDFFLIEFQRVLFAENVLHTIAVRDFICSFSHLTFW